MQRRRRPARRRQELGGVDLDHAVQQIEGEAEQAEQRELDRPGQPQRDRHDARPISVPPAIISRRSPNQASSLPTDKA